MVYMFKVLQNGHPASYGNKKWKNCIFESFIEAQNYAREWLGPFEKFVPKFPDIASIYDDSFNCIEIRTIPDTLVNNTEVKVPIELIGVG